ncbi:MAG TPA: CHASE2 domain-containing protein, partial [Pyrinomonadaceae bacterium]|nr:CHASE2 domain-containing protein [Pyrinomonadaceae bacterium]
MSRRIRSQIVSTTLILLVSLSAVVAVTWFVPSFSAATLNMLFRLRGSLPPPNDVVIVAVDDASLQEVGNWPWPRSVMASVLDKITSANPRAVGLDVIYAENSDTADDNLLTEAIRHNGRVVLPAQLTEVETAKPDSQAGASNWLMPLPEIKGAAAAIGHAHADPDVDGVLRTIQLSKADAEGTRLWAFGLETLRVAEAIPTDKVEEKKDSLRLGRYEIAIHDEAEQSSIPGVTVIRPNEMFINYLGPPGTFPYYSIADVLHGNVPASTFTNKIVLIGAVAQTMGDTRITPFVAYGGAENRSGTGMPGVEVHANVIETIRRGAWLRPLSDWLSFAVALVVILLASVLIRLLDGWRAVMSLAALLALIIIGSLYVFNHLFIIPPVVPMLTGFFTVVPLLLLNNSIMASRDLDNKLETLARIQKRFMSNKEGRETFQTPLSFIASILRAETVALFQKTAHGAYQLKTYAGRNPNEDKIGINEKERVDDSSTPSLRVPLVDDAEVLGELLVKRSMNAEPFIENERKLAHEFASSLAAELRATERNSELQALSLPVRLPHNIIWKLRAVDDITAHLIARIGFMNRVFTSMTDGLLVADITGQVVFANPAAIHFWDDLDADALAGRTLTELFVERKIFDLERLRETMREVMSGRTVQMEVEQVTSAGRFYTLQFSAVISRDDTGIELSSETDDSIVPARQKIIGLIVIITDVTKRRELERVKAETLQLVSHELRTPLTSIRGLSDLLLKYPVPAGESKEILETIYSEAVRMNELINRYLDVTRIESGAQLLTSKPVAANDLITECAQSLSPLASEKGIQINLKLKEPSPTLFGDAQLLTQAINNLLSNA